jgi:ligand-binding SRPBCC domain-containing protein
MPTIKLETLIQAPAETCFDLMRDPRVHTQTSSIVEGRMGPGQTVTFESTQLGMQQRMRVEVVEFERPNLLVDEMIEGTFKAFKHIHEFVPHDSGTLVKDTIMWKSPFGILGRIIDSLFIERHLTDLVSGRNSRLKQLAEETARPAS